MKMVLVNLFIFVVVTSRMVFIPMSMSIFGNVGINVDVVTNEINYVCGDYKGGIKYWRWVYSNNKLIGMVINVQCINQKK